MLQKRRLANVIENRLTFSSFLPKHFKLMNIAEDSEFLLPPSGQKHQILQVEGVCGFSGVLTNMTLTCSPNSGVH